MKYVTVYADETAYAAAKSKLDTPHLAYVEGSGNVYSLSKKNDD